MLPESKMQTTLLLQVTEVEFDFDEEDFTPEQQQEVVDYALGNTFEVEVDDANDEREVAEALVECVTDLTSWCVVSLNYRQVSN
jgi:exoribonuclease R